MTDRRCDSPTCDLRLGGVRGHGWPTADGRGVLCFKCGNPEPKRKRKARR